MLKRSLLTRPVFWLCCAVIGAGAAKGELREDPMQIRWRLEAEFEADKKIQRAFNRLRKRYRNKTLAHVIADKGQPYYVNRPFHYFYLGNVGQMGWYIEVSATRTGGADSDPRNYSVQSVNAASSYEINQRYGL